MVNVAGQPERVVAARVFLWGSGAKVIVSDIENTIARRYRSVLAWLESCFPMRNFEKVKLSLAIPDHAMPCHATPRHARLCHAERCGARRRKVSLVCCQRYHCRCDVGGSGRLRSIVSIIADVLLFFFHARGHLISRAAECDHAYHNKRQVFSSFLAQTP